MSNGPQGTGSGGITPVQTWSVIITLIGGILLQGFKLWVDAAYRDGVDKKDAEKTAAIQTVIDKQEMNHEVLKSVANKAVTVLNKVEAIKVDTKELVNNNSPVGTGESPAPRTKPLGE